MFRPIAYQFEPTSTTGLDRIGNDGLEGGEEGPEHGQDETPSGERIVSIGTASRRSTMSAHALSLPSLQTLELTRIRLRR